jgi:hypothetical protein
MQIRTLLSTAEKCPVDRTCPSVHELDTDPEHRYVISKRLTTPAEVAALEPLLGEGEVAGYMPAGFIPEGNVMLERTRGLEGLGLRTDRQYVIVRRVTDPAVLVAFANLMAGDEVLGTVPNHVLLEV